MKRIFIIFTILLLFTVLKAEEKITDFNVILTLNTDASATVTENITVNAENKSIKRGIYRTIPFDRNEKITVINLFMDGQPHPYFIQKRSGILTVNFGNDNFISQGLHKYSLTYKFENAVNFFKEYDEIYWNVTGNKWSFKIEKASFELILPQDALPLKDKISLYTGRYGSKEHNAKQTADLCFETTKILEINEGFSVAVPFLKNAVIKHSFFDKNKTNIVIVIILIILPFIYSKIIKRFYIGSDMKDRIILRNFTPPANISPAFAGYVASMNAGTAFTTVIVSLALKGIIEIEYDSLQSAYVLKNKLNTIAPELSDEENAAYRTLFPVDSSSHVVLSGYVKKIAEARKNLISSLKTQESGNYFKKNILWSLPLCLFILFLAAYGQISGLIIFAALFFAIIFTKEDSIPWFLTFFVAFTLSIINGNVPFFFSDSFFIFTIGFICLVIISILITKSFRRYTEKGRFLMDEIDGFKQYIKSVEEYRVELSDPTNAQKIFCDYLPFAIAFKMDNKWINSFGKILDKTMIDEALKTRGIHTHQGIFFANGISNFTNALNASSSAKRSGSGGGGFSGGGRGGGGGGGGGR
ncbi:MAG: DUF2207 domain-containing protein [Endomicrobiaceae bacterium]|nr:DUF2207 domain-containing protein [Endomicrobiaceae bacterium]